MPGKLGLPEILLILAVALLIFGPSKLADLGKVLGEGIKNFKSAVKDGELTCCDGEGDSAQCLNRGISCSERTRDVCRRHHCVTGRQRRPPP